MLLAWSLISQFWWILPCSIQRHHHIQGLNPSKGGQGIENSQMILNANFVKIG